MDLFRGNLWQPMRDLMSIQRGINRLFDDVALPAVGGPEIAFAPITEVEETDSQWLMKLDLPGVKKENIKIEINDGVLTVGGELKEERKEDKKSRHVSERIYGSFMRSFVLPASVKQDQIEASYENGVLTLAIPKAEAAKAMQIPIGEGKVQSTQKIEAQKSGSKGKESKVSHEEDEGTSKVA